MKKTILLVVATVLCLFVIVFGTLFALGMYYKKVFPVNTWINNVYCTGKTFDDVKEEIINNIDVPDIVIIGPDGSQHTISAQVIELEPNIDNAMIVYQESKGYFSWLKNINEPEYTNLNGFTYLFDKDKLTEEVALLDFVAEELSKPYSCKLTYDKTTGYSFYDGNKKRLQTEEMLDELINNVSNGYFELDLTNENFFDDMEYSALDLEYKFKWEKLEKYFNQHMISFDMGAEQVILSYSDLAGFLKKDSNNMPLIEDSFYVIDKELTDGWIDDLATAYNTVDTIKQFHATRDEIVEVPYVTYGTLLNSDKEKEYLYEMLTSEIIWEDVHTPSYLQEGYYRGLDDIGDTYIEVDMTKQHMYYYLEGELVLDTDIVTGNTGRKMGTPEGINFVYGKQKNRVLRGADYATPVKFWMPVKGAIGIHDANWRSTFGGEIYKTNGSHGCINTPTEIMSELYDLVEIGTPVVMFY